MTDLPIDGSDLPMRSKYIIDETPTLNRWIIFGVYPGGTHVDIHEPWSGTDIFTRIPIGAATRILAARHVFCAVLEEELCL